VTKFDGEPIFEFEESPPPLPPPLNEDDGNVGGLNFTPYLPNPLVPLKVSLIMESCVTFMVNLNPKLGVTKF